MALSTVPKAETEHFASAQSFYCPPSAAANASMMTIRTPHHTLRLIRRDFAGQDSARVPDSNSTARALAMPGWFWEIRTVGGQVLGFIGLALQPSADDACPAFGPYLDLLLPRKDVYRGDAVAAVEALTQWLSSKRVCHVLHASHTVEDDVLGEWLQDAGFLYTGCRSKGLADGSDRRHMIMLL